MIRRADDDAVEVLFLVQEVAPVVVRGVSVFQAGAGGCGLAMRGIGVREGGDFYVGVFLIGGRVADAATTSADPVFEGSWIEPGALICAVGSNWLRKTEIDTTTVSRARIVVCDDIACCQHEAGDFREALDQGLFEWDRARALAEVVAAATPTRQNDSDIIVFKSVGMALEDVALGGQLLDRAQQEHKGIALPF